MASYKKLTGFLLISNGINVDNFSEVEYCAQPKGRVGRRYMELTKMAPLRHGIVTPNCKEICWDYWFVEQELKCKVLYKDLS